MTEQLTLSLYAQFIEETFRLWTDLTVFSRQSVASVVAQTVKRLPAMWETWVRFLGQEDPLEKEMAIHSSTLAWKIPWTEEPDRLQSIGVAKSWT